MAMPDRREKNRRLRAAWAYSGLTYAELAERSGVDIKLLRTYLERANPSLPPDESLLYAITSTCGIPKQFMDVGFAPLEDAISDVEREVYALRDGQAALEARLSALEAGKTRIGARLAPVATGEETGDVVEHDAAPRRHAK